MPTSVSVFHPTLGLGLGTGFEVGLGLSSPSLLGLIVGTTPVSLLPVNTAREPYSSILGSRVEVWLRVYIYIYGLEKLLWIWLGLRLEICRGPGIALGLRLGMCLSVESRDICNAIGSSMTAVL